ncbi:MAG: DUF6778 family protein [Yoonia sp.]|uniref:DUF6778 family protein n=1 Tax=Yoonia sp. TaxID=2212373 RepID=UPI0021FA5842|nr:hypothetical protein K3729_01845 [Rhodobacteraceae bacterium S2214]
MKTRILTLCLALLAGCSGSWETDYGTGIENTVSQKWRVREVNVAIPDDLTTTETNSYAPNADVVWHEDPVGDRRMQVAEILTDGVRRGARPLRGSKPVNLDVMLYEFHALTPLARAKAPSAVHNIAFSIQVVDARTGEPLTEPEFIRADLEAHVGEAAFEAFQQGETQKVRITRHLQQVTASWLGIGPDVRRSFSSAGR